MSLPACSMELFPWSPVMRLTHAPSPQLQTPVRAASLSPSIRHRIGARVMNARALESYRFAMRLAIRRSHARPERACPQLERPYFGKPVTNWALASGEDCLSLAGGDAGTP